MSVMSMLAIPSRGSTQSSGRGSGQAFVRSFGHVFGTGFWGNFGRNHTCGEWREDRRRLDKRGAEKKTGGDWRVRGAEEDRRRLESKRSSEDAREKLDTSRAIKRW
ncbi:hypothetical protein E1301_Tti013301 [Triplophysa tibetana]|uniref:Uncharacterized protein n=1 Tax=Triplophysa tibetana TaxID=1572043 RepID=A0A5A9N1V7_9TELE|nr:hypothetical protein E1301_Tti013301 [Triplophysa tibetana]